MIGFNWERSTQKLHSSLAQRDTPFFISSNFISNDTLKLAKNQANAKQHPEAELLVLENYSHSSSTLLSENNRTHSIKQAKEQSCLYSWDYTINHNDNEDENKK